MSHFTDISGYYVKSLNNIQQSYNGLQKSHIDLNNKCNALAIEVNKICVILQSLSVGNEVKELRNEINKINLQLSSQSSQTPLLPTLSLSSAPSLSTPSYEDFQNNILLENEDVNIEDDYNKFMEKQIDEVLKQEEENQLEIRIEIPPTPETPPETPPIQLIHETPFEELLLTSKPVLELEPVPLLLSEVPAPTPIEETDIDTNTDKQNIEYINNIISSKSVEPVKRKKRNIKV